MTPTEILNTLTPAQKEEFNIDIQNLVIKAGKEYNFDYTKVAEVNVNMRLKDDIYFYVSLAFHIDEQKKVTGVITDLKRYKTVDEYLDALNAAKTPPDGFNSLKP